MPTYCEADNVERMVGALRAAAPDRTHVLVVDDASPDGTGAIAGRLAAADERVSVLRREGRRGLGPAYVDGFAHALARGAGSSCRSTATSPTTRRSCPCCSARSRRGRTWRSARATCRGGGVENWAAWRRAVSRAGCAYARAVLRVPVRDLTGGLQVLARGGAATAIGFASARARGYAFQVELTHRALRAGLRVVELPITFRERREGRVEALGRVALEAAWRVPAAAAPVAARGCRSTGR